MAGGARRGLRDGACMSVRERSAAATGASPERGARGASARHALSAVLRIVVAGAIVVGLHSLTHFSAWWLLVIGLAAALLLAGSAGALPFMARWSRNDRLAPWIVLVVLTVIGYLHNANDWNPDGQGLLRPDRVGLWKTELVLGVALAVPLLHSFGRLLRRSAQHAVGQQFAREFALYINFSGVALALWDGDALLSKQIGATLLAWMALAELTLYASD